MEESIGKVETFAGKVMIFAILVTLTILALVRYGLI
jgi:hypothetical protein